MQRSRIVQVVNYVVLALWLIVFGLSLAQYFDLVSFQPSLFVNYFMLAFAIGLSLLASVIADWQHADRRAVWRRHLIAGLISGVILFAILFSWVTWVT